MKVVCHQVLSALTAAAAAEQASMSALSCMEANMTAGQAALTSLAANQFIMALGGRHTHCDGGDAFVRCITGLCRALQRARDWSRRPH